MALTWDFIYLYFSIMISERKKIRIIEIITGLFLILSVLSLMVAFLLNYDFTVPNATFAEDLDFLADNINRQKVSAYCWITAGAAFLFFMPLYLVLFHRFQPGMHIVASFFLLVAAAAFFNSGLRALHIAETVAGVFDKEITDNAMLSLDILLDVKYINTLYRAGLTAFGAFATVFTISRFSNVRFPVFGSTLAFLAGPLVIAFTWLNPGHVVMTLALAAAWTGLIIIGADLTVMGMHPKAGKEEHQ